MEYFRKLSNGDRLRDTDWFSDGYGRGLTHSGGQPVNTSASPPKTAYFRPISEADALHMDGEVFVGTENGFELAEKPKDPPECLPPDHIPAKPDWKRFGKSALYLILLPILHGLIKKPRS